MSLAYSSSFFGGCFSISIALICLIVFGPYLRDFGALFGQRDIFMAAALGSVYSGWQYSSWSEYCDSTSVDSVCGNVFGDNIVNGAEQSVSLTYLSGYGFGCSDPSTSYTGEDLASLYCGLAGYSSYVQFDVIKC